MTTAYEYGMYDNLTQSEIDELAAISENRTFRTLTQREWDLKSQYYDDDENGRNRSLSYYQIMRPTVVLMATHLEKQLATCRNLRVRAIVGGYLQSMLDKMEYHSNILALRFVDLIKAHPNMSDAELAKLCVAHKIELFPDEPEKNSDIDHITTIMQDVRMNMNSWQKAGTSPITARESIYAARWLEIFERGR